MKSISRSRCAVEVVRHVSAKGLGVQRGCQPHSEWQWRLCRSVQRPNEWTVMNFAMLIDPRRHIVLLYIIDPSFVPTEEGRNAIRLLFEEHAE